MLLGLSALAAASSMVRGGDESASSRAPWVDAIRVMDEALAKGDVRSALSAREDARLAALSSDGWEGLVLVGDATLRLAQGSGLRVAMEPAARRAYVFALHRARRQESFEGVVRVTEALVTMGDLDMARKGCRVAGALAAAAGAPDARERVRALEDRLTSLARSVPAASAAPMPSASSHHLHDERGFDGSR
jgi:hypothetical protein